MPSQSMAAGWPSLLRDRIISSLPRSKARTGTVPPSIAASERTNRLGFIVSSRRELQKW